MDMIFIPLVFSPEAGSAGTDVALGAAS